MYYQERVINGILHFRLTPDGEFREVSKEELTRRLERARELLYEANERIERFEDKINSL